MSPMGLHEGKILAIDMVSQNRLITIKNHEIWRRFEKEIGSRVLGATLGVYPLRQSFRSWQALFNNTLKSEISLMVENLMKFKILLVLGPRGISNRSPWG